MPRDANGNYTLPAGNPVISGTAITTVWANPTMQDLAIAITDSLSRTGEGGMLVPFLFPDGAVATPGMSWTNETKTGFYRAGTNDQRVSVNGVDSFRWTATGVQVWNSVDLIWEDVAIGANYLPLSGGTLTGSNAVLKIARTTTGEGNYIEFVNQAGELTGRVGRVDTANADIELSSVGVIDIISPTAINLNAPTTFVNGVLSCSSIIQGTNFRIDRAIANPALIEFFTASSLKSYIGLLPNSDNLEIQNNVAINLNAPTVVMAGVGAGLVVQMPASIQNDFNVNTPLANKSGMNIFKDSGFSAFIGVVAGEQTTLRLNADLGDINLTTPTSIELNAPVVNVNGVPIGGQPKAGQKVGDGGTLHLVTFATPYPDTNYSAVATQYNSIGSVVSTNGKTTTGFYIITSVATNTLLDWIATPYS